jgi:hypothetical protein
MTIIDTYDNMTFTLIMVFLFIFLFSIITLIMFNIKSRKLQNTSLYNNNPNKPNNPNGTNSTPTLQCTPRQTLVGNVVQMTC